MFVRMARSNVYKLIEVYTLERADSSRVHRFGLHGGLSPGSKAPVPSIFQLLFQDAPMASKNLFLLPGDGIGPEAMAEVVKLIAAMNERLGSGIVTDEGLVGGCAYDAHGQAISDADMEKAMAADAVLFGAV